MVKHLVGHNQILDAYGAFRKVSNMAYNHNTWQAFGKFTGFKKDNYHAHKDAFTVTEDTLKKLEWLNGPHAHTLYQAWLAQNEKAL